MTKKILGIIVLMGGMCWFLTSVACQVGSPLNITVIPAKTSTDELFGITAEVNPGYFQVAPPEDVLTSQGQSFSAVVCGDNSGNMSGTISTPPWNGGDAPPEGGVFTLNFNFNGVQTLNQKVPTCSWSYQGSMTNSSGNCLANLNAGVGTCTCNIDFE